MFSVASTHDDVYPQGIYKIKRMMNYHFEDDVPYLVTTDGKETIIGMVSPAAWQYVKDVEVFTEDRFYIGENCVFYGRETHKCQIKGLRHKHRKVVYVFLNKLKRWV